MSFGHHDPALSAMACRGCGELVASKAHLVRDPEHDGRSCCMWHPYHLWCIRPRDEGGPFQGGCAFCHSPISSEDLRSALTWLLASLVEPHRPLAVPTVVIWRRVAGRGEVHDLEPLLGLSSRTYEGMLRGCFEPVHRACAERSQLGR